MKTDTDAEYRHRPTTSGVTHSWKKT